MAVLGQLSGKTLIHFGSVEMLFTILLCYTIAVLEGHVKPWLPTISACGDTPPEQFVFRFGILTGSMLLVVLALYVYTADFPFSRDKINLTMGVVAGLSLGVVAICADNEDNLVHTTCAVIFFVLEDILLFHITLQSQGSSLPQLSVVVKATCTLIAWFTSIARLFLIMGSAQSMHIGIGSFDVPVLPILEWSDTLAVLAFHWSFAFDFSPAYFIVAWKSDDSAEKPSSLKPINDGDVKR